MIKITREFATVQEAVAFLQGGAANTGTGSYAGNPPAQPAANPPAFLHNAPPVPAQPTYTPPPQASVLPPATGYAPQPGVNVPPVAQPPAGLVVTQAQVAAAAQNYAKVHGPKAAKAKFAELGVTKISEIQPANYAYSLQALAA